MRKAVQFFGILVMVFLFSGSGIAQLAEICGETGGSMWLSSPAVYGHIGLNGFDPGKRLPKITVTLVDRQRNERRITIDRTGNYCFSDVDGNGGFLVVDIEGVEVGRETLPTGGSIKQNRQDFDIYAPGNDPQKPAGTISAKNYYPRKENNSALMQKAVAEETNRQFDKAIEYLKQIVSDDPADFFAWAKLGSIYFDQNKISEAEWAFAKALFAKPDHTASMLNLGRIYLQEKRVEDAINILQKETQIDPTTARGFQLLGESYLLAKKGTLGVAALNEAVRLDPIGMAECHLLMARLYDLAGGKSLASREYRLFLEKVPEYKDKKKLQQYIKDNPEQ